MDNDTADNEPVSIHRLSEEQSRSGSRQTNPNGFGFRKCTFPVSGIYQSAVYEGSHL